MSIMGGLISSTIAYLEVLATKIPLELFTVVGTITEEVIAPIPSPLVMTLTGSITRAQNAPLSYIFFLAIIGAAGKTFGSWIVYFISGKAEDLILNKFGKFFGVMPEDIEKIGKYFNGTWKDEVTIGLLRAIPVMSTALVSVACGILKVNLRSFLVATFFGCIVRNIIFLYLGYTGLAASESVSEGLSSTESFFQILFIGGIVVSLAYGYIRRNKGNLAFFKDPDNKKNKTK